MGIPLWDSKPLHGDAVYKLGVDPPSAPIAASREAFALGKKGGRGEKCFEELSFLLLQLCGNLQERSGSGPT